MSKTSFKTNSFLNGERPICNHYQLFKKTLCIQKLTTKESFHPHPIFSNLAKATIGNFDNDQALMKIITSIIKILSKSNSMLTSTHDLGIHFIAHPLKFWQIFHNLISHEPSPKGSVITLTLSSWLKQGLANVQAKNETQESHFMFSGVQESVKEWTPTLPSELLFWELKSKWTFKFSKGDCRGQNSLDWKFPYIIRKLLELRCLKWAHMTHLGF